MKWLFALFMFVAGTAYSQEQQLIVRVPRQSEGAIERIGRQLACLDGVHFSGYVNQASCLLIRYNVCTISDERIITSVIHHLNKKLKVEVINGYTAYEVIDGKLK